MTINELLQQAQKPPAEKTRSKALEVKAEGEMLELVRKLLHLKYTIQDLTSQFKLSTSELLTLIEPIRAEHSRKKYISSMRVGSVEENVMVVWAHKYTKIPLEREEELRQMVGERYDEFFTTVVKIILKKTDESTLLELVGKLGKDKFLELFEVERYLYPTIRYTENFYTLPPTKRSMLSKMVKQAEPAIK